MLHNAESFTMYYGSPLRNVKSAVKTMALTPRSLELPCYGDDSAFQKTLDESISEIVSATSENGLEKPVFAIWDAFAEFCNDLPLPADSGVRTAIQIVPLWNEEEPDRAKIDRLGHDIIHRAITASAPSFGRWVGPSRAVHDLSIAAIGMYDKDCDWDDILFDVFQAILVIDTIDKVTY